MTELGIEFFKTALKLFGVAMVPLLVYALRSVGSAFDLKVFLLTSKMRIALVALLTMLIAGLRTADPETIGGLVSLGSTIYLIAFSIGAFCVAAIGGSKTSA